MKYNREQMIEKLNQSKTILLDYQQECLDQAWTGYLEWASEALPKFTLRAASMTKEDWLENIRAGNGSSVLSIPIPPSNYRAKMVLGQVQSMIVQIGMMPVDKNGSVDVPTHDPFLHMFNQLINPTYLRQS